MNDTLIKKRISKYLFCNTKEHSCSKKSRSGVRRATRRPLQWLQHFQPPFPYALKIEKD